MTPWPTSVVGRVPAYPAPSPMVEPNNQPTANMSASKFSLALVAASSLVLGNVALAGAKSYQATGPILELTDTTILIQKGTEKWEFNRDDTTKVTGDLKVGAKVTIAYTMTATKIEVKGAEKAADKPTEKATEKPAKTPTKVADKAPAKAADKTPPKKAGTP